jgi:long-subunit fatty acid transport protein
MKRIIYTTLIFLFATVFWTTVSIAQVEEMAIGNTFGVGARTMGMGGASLALADDFTALYWNPAGMAQIQKFELFSSFSHNTANTESYFTGDEITGTTRSQMRPNSIGFVYPFLARRGGWAIAFGYNRPQNFDYQTAIQGIDPSSGTEFSGLAVDETDVNSGGIGIWSFGTSVYVSKRVLIGGSLDFWQGQSLNELDTTATDLLKVDGELSRFRYDDEIDREYSGLGARIGLLAHLTDAISVGLTLVAPVELGVDEIWYQSTRAVYDDGEEMSDVTDGAQAFDIERPFEIGTGVAVKLFDKRLVLAGDVQLTDWTQTRYDPAPADDISQDNFEKFYATTLQARLGLEYRIPIIDTHARVGYFRDTIPFTDAEVNNARDFLTVGVGKIFEDSLKFDVGYMLGTWQRSRNDLTTERLTHRVFVSAAYRF